MYSKQARQSKRGARDGASRRLMPCNPAGQISKLGAQAAEALEHQPPDAKLSTKYDAIVLWLAEYRTSFLGCCHFLG